MTDAQSYSERLDADPKWEKMTNYDQLSDAQYLRSRMSNWYFRFGWKFLTYDVDRFRRIADRLDSVDAFIKEFRQ